MAERKSLTQLQREALAAIGRMGPSRQEELRLLGNPFLEGNRYLIPALAERYGGDTPEAAARYCRERYGPLDRWPEFIPVEVREVGHHG